MNISAISTLLIIIFILPYCRNATRMIIKGVEKAIVSAGIEDMNQAVPRS